MLISNSNSRDLIRKPIYKKGYVLIFVLGIISIIVGLSITTAITFIPSKSSMDPDYDDYIKLMQRLPSVSILFQNIGIALFSVSTFIGAITDETLSREVKRGMIITSGIGIVALVLSRVVFLMGYGYL